MRSRRLQKRIEVWQTNDGGDDFGGNTIVYDTQITKTWAEIKTLTETSFGARLTDLGITNTQLAISVKVRKRSDFEYNSINQFIIYNSDRYVINTFPTNTGFNNTYISFIAVKEMTKIVPSLSPIGVGLIVSGYKSTVEAFNGSLSSEECTTQFVTRLNT